MALYLEAGALTRMVMGLLTLKIDVQQILALKSFLDVLIQMVMEYLIIMMIVHMNRAQ